MGDLYNVHHIWGKLAAGPWFWRWQTDSPNKAGGQAVALGFHLLCAVILLQQLCLWHVHRCDGVCLSVVLCVEDILTSYDEVNGTMDSGHAGCFLGLMHRYLHWWEYKSCMTRHKFMIVFDRSVASLYVVWLHSRNMLVYLMDTSHQTDVRAATPRCTDLTCHLLWWRLANQS